MIQLAATVLDVRRVEERDKAAPSHQTGCDRDVKDIWSQEELGYQTTNAIITGPLALPPELPNKLYLVQ